MSTTAEATIPPPAPKPETSYGQILKSTAWVGGSSVINILIGMVRTKAMAVLLGPTGFGLAGMYMSVVNLAQSIAGMGVNSSGVRQIAEAVGSGDEERIAKTVTVLRKTSVVLGLLGGLLLVAFAGPVSTLTFGNDQQKGTICLLAVAVVLQLVSAGQGALIQGMRRISDMAKMSVLGALFGTIAAILLVFFFREQGVALSLVAVAALTLLFSWWFSRQIPIDATSLSSSEVGQEASALLKLGFAFMISGLLMMASAYVTRIIITRQIGLEATGLYQAAWTLGGLYVGMILQAMGADFYPRLTAVITDRIACNRLVNEQSLISILLAGPGVLATVTFAPFVLSLFYATSFEGALAVLRWICLGIMMRVISWPLGFIVMAKGRRDLIIFCELSWSLVNITLTWVCVRRFALAGAGIAFFLSYLFHILLTYTVARSINDFRWSADNKKMLFLYVPLLLFATSAFYLVSPTWAFALAVTALVFITVHSFRLLVTLGATDSPLPFVRHLTARLGGRSIA